MSNKTKLSLLIGLIVVIGLGAISFAAVDRYVVRDVGAVVASTQEVATTRETATSQRASTTTDAASSEDSGYKATETSYTSATTSITVKKVAIGSGANTVTYYVADVTLSSGTDLRTGSAGVDFAGNSIDDTSAMAASYDAVFAINGDYFGARDDGVIIRNGVLYRDVPVRTGLAIYEDGRMEIFNEKEISAEQLLADGVWSTYSFGPALVDEGIVPGDIDTYEVEANPRHPIQGTNPRTGIGIIDNNHFVFVVVDGRDAGYSRGVTMNEFAQIFESLGCSTAYNLDGGGSSTMYFMGNVVNNPLGQDNERRISDILFIAG